jgi:hypothetical protein
MSGPKATAMQWRRNLVVILVLAVSSPPEVAVAAERGAEVVIFETWREPNEAAFTIDVPRDWRISGGVRRFSPLDVRIAISAVSPDGQIRIFIGDYDLVPRREPDAATQMAGWREGQMVPGGLIARYMSGVQFAERYPGWKLCRQPRISQSGILQRETQVLNAQVARFGQGMGLAASASVGEAIFRCPEGEGFVMATTLLIRPAYGQGVSGWFVYQLSGFISRDPAQAYFAKYILSAMLASQKMNPQWEARVAQAGSQYASSMMQMSNAVTQTTIQHARQQAAQGSAGGWNHPNTANLPKITRDPGVEARRDAANRGTRSVCDDLGTCKTVDNAWSTVWRDHNGNVVPGSASGYPPDYSGQWTQMK